MSAQIVELFEMSDVREETFEQSAEAAELVSSLGLEGQKAKPPTPETEVLTRFPYRIITDEESFIYNQLCPEKCDVHAFKNAPIPLEVLKCIAYAKSLNDKRIAYLEVWAASSIRVKDPILVGRDQKYGHENYILARWGEELLPLAVLLPDALKVWYAKRIDALNEIKAEVERGLMIPCPQGLPKNSALPYFGGL